MLNIMAQYIGSTTNNAIICMQDIQQLCQINGQTVQLVVSDITSTGNVLTRPLTTYTPEPREHTILTQPHNFGNQVPPQFNSRQNVYVIQTNDSHQTTIHHLDADNSKLPSEKAVKNKIPIGSMHYSHLQNPLTSAQTTRTQTYEVVLKHTPASLKSFSNHQNNQQNIIPSQSSLQMQKAPDRFTVKQQITPANNLQTRNFQSFGKMKRHSLPSNQTGVPSHSRLSTSGLNAVISPPSKPHARPPIHQNTNQGTLIGVKNTNQEMFHLSEKIKQQQKQSKSQKYVMYLKSMQQSQLVQQSPNSRPRFSGHGVNQSSVQQSPPQQIHQHTNLQNSPIRQPQNAMQFNEPDQFMEVDESHPDNLNQPNLQRMEIETQSESYAYLQQEIKDPATTIVQHQIPGNEAKMLVMLQSGEQRLITFEVPKEDCTVQDLLEQANIVNTSDTNVSLVSDPTLGINYIVDVGSNALNTEDETVNPQDPHPHQSAEFSSPTKSCGTNTSTATFSISPSEPRFIEGYMAVCSFCGMMAADFNHCMRCKRKLPGDVKKVQIPIDSKPNLTPKKENVSTMNVIAVYNKKSPDQNNGRCDPVVGKRGGKVAKPRSSTRQKTVKEPECLTISSDEDDDCRRKCYSSLDELHHMLQSKKEQDPTDIPPNLHTSVVCRTVRIGSYKYIPLEPVRISAKGVSLTVPLLEDENSRIGLEIPYSDILQVLYHSAKVMPTIFLITTATFAQHARDVLGMQDPKGFYFDPAGNVEIHKKITLLPDAMDDDAKNIIKKLFKSMLREITYNEANEILLLTSGQQNPKKTALSNKNNTNTVVRITSYGGLSINTEDYSCLAEDQFLNDVIIEFYLNYFVSEIISPTDRNRTYVFSPFFYERLTRRKQSGEKPNISPEWRRFKKVEKWTKNVDIFEKDFLIIPINEHAHWFLAIICFPGLVTKPDPSLQSIRISKRMKEKEKIQSSKSNDNATTVNTITLENDEDSERDEAEGDELELETDSEEEDSDRISANTNNQSSTNSEIIKNPCILIFDSLAGPDRSKVVATLRDYLSCEHQDKLGIEKEFSANTMKGAAPKVPQQSNFTDCGLYVLQYVESFFQSPIKNFTLPIRTLRNWFEEIVVTRKREELAQLLVTLIDKTKGDEKITLPTLIFPTQNGLLKPKPIELKSTKSDNDKKKVLEEETRPVASFEKAESSKSYSKKLSQSVLEKSAEKELLESIKSKELNQDLPGHADEVYAVDWAPDGIRVASGGKDKVLRLWQN